MAWKKRSRLLYKEKKKKVALSYTKILSWAGILKGASPLNFLNNLNIA